ncbi:hypothetical protein U9M48_020372 [Paspalum notatum var. saurae]|uniref:Integrase catalytic domain-containing protein n=1 Tax=Paspalum notatum var. saurae TaxID=547442 RepID=A0AAQ3THY0_PASNO
MTTVTAAKTPRRPPPSGEVHLVEKVFAALDDAPVKEPRRWIFDTGASNHMIGARAAFSDLDTGIAGTVRFGDGSVVRIKGCGTVLFDCKNGEHRALPNTYFIPRLTANIISCGQLGETGFEILIGDGVMRVRNEQRRLLAKIHHGPGSLYALDLTIVRPVCLAAHTGEDAWRWHAQFGHTNFTVLRKMGREGLHASSSWTRCVRLASPTSSGVLHSPTKLSDAQQRSWSSYTGISAADQPHDAKRESVYVGCPPARQTRRARCDQACASSGERKTGKQLRALRMDRGGEFTTKHFTDYCAELGVWRELTAPYTPQQNGVTVVAAARSMLKGKDLPGQFWEKAITTAVYVLNRTTTKVTGGKTPYELMNGTAPTVHHLRMFGCVAHVKVATPHPKKLDDRSRAMIFVRYEPGSKAYRVYDPDTRRVHVSRDVVLNEEAQWDWKDDREECDNDFVIKYTAATSSPFPALDSPIEPVSPSNEEDEALDVDHDDDAPRRYRTLDNILGSAPNPGLARRNQDEEVHMANIDEPGTFEEARAHECWRNAMLDEMTSIESNGTWELVDPPPHQGPIGLKWVFKTKKDTTGIIIKHKARLVAKGYVQRQGIDYEEVFTPVARIESVRLLLALAVSKGWPVHHMDVKSAFLNGELREQVYVAQLPGFVVAGEEQKVMRLIKALYGLRQAPRAWYAKLDASLASLGLQHSSSEHAVYTRGEGAHRLIVGVYVDDLIITGGDTTELQQFKEEMKRTF